MAARSEQASALPCRAFPLGRLLGPLAAATLLAGCASAPDAPRPREERAREAAERIVRVELKYGFPYLLDQATDAGVAAIEPALAAELGRELTHEEHQRLATVFRTAMANVYPADLWAAEISRAYQRVFSAEDLEALADFYESPTGRRMVQLAPLIDKELEAAGEAVLETRSEQLAEALAAELADEFESTQEEPGRVLTIAESIEACRRVQDRADVPITCEVDYHEGRPVMFVGFGDEDSMNAHWNAMADAVTAPFCDAANSANRSAFVGIQLMSPRVWRLYSCERGEWSEWIPVGGGSSGDF